mgnify:CR=1 FL=1
MTELEKLKAERFDDQLDTITRGTVLPQSVQFGDSLPAITT